MKRLQYPPRHECLPLTRREMLCRSGSGMGALALASVVGGASVRGAQAAGRFESPLAPKAPHFPARAKRVIHLFMGGGPSH
ncbi:MAG TPA: DUF1501 domain-containing protein, partial [Planctomycetaceae bacterium]|nr:DUF1501 domain-containing protein [Planctomycetaceae bacterium]